MATDILSDSKRGITFKSSKDYIKVSRAGLSFAQVKKILQFTGIPLSKISELISLSNRQIARYTNETILKSNISAHLIQILDLYKFGFKVFEDQEKFKLWMNSEIRALNFQQPINLLDTPFGIDEVRTILGRIEYGVYS